ncbi:MAG: ABC transporter ATP-binding protein [Myxococcales bacterium]|nr:ABC transporter ATP-binding protein [Myxococcales bacterium]
MSLSIAPGERLAVVGENGAGKSSLMNVLYGLYHPDAGEVRFDGTPVKVKTPAEALARGVGMVHQHFTLVPTLTVAENVVLGAEPRRGGLLDLDAAIAQVQASCRRFGFSVDARARVDTLTVGSQQKVEIVKALHRGVGTLILDEPTAVLTPQEADELFAVTRALSESGLAVVLISHKLKEVLAFATRVAVMRRGKKVAEVRPAETSADALAELMVGEKAVSLPPGPLLAGRGEAALRVEHLRTDKLHDVSFSLHAGEILGIAGVDGNGQRELALVLTGLRDYTGTLELFGRRFPYLTPGQARAQGVAHIPEDRLHRAVVADLTVEENVALGRHAAPPFAKGPLIDFAGRRQRTAALLEANDVRPRDGTLRVGALSGGNQQKLVVGRELDGQPKVLVVVQPTRGLDIAAVAQVRRRLDEERRRGCAVLLVSLDLDEVLALSDRVLVFFEGRVTAELDRAHLDERLIGRRMLGVADA